MLRAENSADGPWSLDHLDVEAHTGTPASVTVRLAHADGRVLERKASGDGPVDAAFKAIIMATGVSVTLSKFEVHAVTTGEDAQGEAVLYVEHNGRSYRGSSISTDIVEAANRALLEVINRIEQAQKAGRFAGDRRDESARLARLAQSAV